MRYCDASQTPTSKSTLVDGVDRSAARFVGVLTPRQSGSTIEVSGVYADLVTALGFKPSVAAEKSLGGFDSHPLPLS